MAALELVLLLLAAAAGLRLVAERLRVPYAAILVVGGLLLAFIPGLPHVTLPPEVLFLVFIPPLLYAGAIAYPLRDFRREIGAILRLSVLLVLISTAAVAVVAHWLHPSFTWAAAITLGAIVSPPDPVAVLSILRPTRRAKYPVFNPLSCGSGGRAFDHASAAHSADDRKYPRGRGPHQRRD